MTRVEDENRPLGHWFRLIFTPFCLPLVAPPERRQVHGNGAAYTVLSVATQRSWKDAQDEWHSKTEWHRIVAWNRLGEYVAAKLRQDDHVLVEGTLVSSTYQREYGKGKNATTAKHTSWQVRADVIRKLNRAEKEPAAANSRPNGEASEHPLESSEGAPF